MLLCGAVGLPTAPRAAAAQLPRIVPPPPCVIPREVQLDPVLRSPSDRRPMVVVESFDLTSTDLGTQHLPQALVARVRDRLRRTPGLLVASEGSTERALSEARGRADSAATLLGGDFVVRGASRTVPLGAEVEVWLLRRGRTAPVLHGKYRFPTYSLAAVEHAVAASVARYILGDGAALAAPAPGTPRRDDTARLLALADHLLRANSLALKDSARRVLERAFAADTTSTLVALRLADAHAQVIARAGATPPIRRPDAMRRAGQLADYALSRDSTLSHAFTTRAIVARLSDPLTFEGALQAHRQAVAADPADARAHHEMGVTLAAMGDQARAAEQFRRALAAEPERSETLAALAALELSAGRFNTACAYANAAVAAWQFDPNAYAVRSQARIRLGQARDAYADSETASRLSDEPWTQGLRLLTEVGAGNREGATALGRQLVARFLGPGRMLGVGDATMLSRGFLAVNDVKSAREALLRATPRGRELAVALRDSAFAPLRGDSVLQVLTAPSTGR